MLTEEMLPTNINLLDFKAQRRLCIKLRPNIMLTSWYIISSLTFCLLIGKICAEIIGSTLRFAVVVDLVTMTTALVVWFLIMKRGVVLDIALDKPSYRLTAPLYRLSTDGIPKLTVSKPKLIKDKYICHLEFGGSRITTSKPTTTRESAKQTFDTFLAGLDSYSQSKSESSDDVHEGAMRTRQISGSPSFSSGIVASTSTPLVILIHGTWGCTSKWAIPDKSVLAKGLFSRLDPDCSGSKFDVRRFEWSGKNRGRARNKAATDLKSVLNNELLSNNRTIFLVAHSHGGNIALRVYRELEKCYQTRVVCILMATPFLRLEQRFDIANIFSSLPKALRNNLETAGLFGFCFLTWSALILLSELLLPDGASRLLNILFYSHSATIWETLVIIILFFMPFLLYIFLNRKLRKLLNQVSQSEQRVIEKENGKMRSFSSIHVVTHTQDEVFQILSLVMNFISIMHHALFGIFFMLARLLDMIKVLDIGWAILGYMFVLPFLLLGLGGSILMLSDTANNIWPFVPSVEDLLHNSIEQIWEVSYKIISTSMVFIFTSLTGFGALCVFMLGVILVLGFFRMCLFLSIGVMDEVKRPVEIMSAILGTVSISTVPVASATTYVLEGRTLFNHTKIYDNEETIDYIADLVVPYLTRNYAS